MHIRSRRGFLKKTLGACWTGAALVEQAVFRADLARAQASESLPKLFDIEKIADGIYAALARPAALINSNAVIFENSQDLLIVDTHSEASAVASLVSQIKREITPKPIRYIVNSHFHWDHTQGNPTYHRIAPHADILASEATRRLLSEKGAERFRLSAVEAEKSVETYKEQLAKTTSPADRQELQQLIKETNAYLAEMKNYQPELPNVTFANDLIIHDKNHDLHLAFRGRAHTAGDVVVYCPQKKVIATGDALHGFLPFIADGYPNEWANTLRRYAEIPFDHIAGGHGAVQHTRDRLYQMGNYIDELTELVKTTKAKKTLAEIQASVNPDTLRSLKDGGYGDFVKQNIERSRPSIPGTTRAEAFTANVRTNIAEIYNALGRS
jgi:cyclase